jgi:ribosomal protein L37AE/L43A
MSTGRRVCPECKGNGFLKTSIGKIVQCLNCWSEGDKVTWDPIKAMVRITFGQVK